MLTLMAILEIIDVPHPTLKKKAKEVEPEEFNEDLKKFVEDLFDTMNDAPGVGLAAPQVNVSKRILVADASSDNPDYKPMAFINPVIVEKSGDCTFEEGCLSIPEFQAEIPRAKKIKVEYQDVNGKKHTIEDDGFLAIILQHEIDHLDGITMLDHVSAVKRMMYLKKIKKLKKLEEPVAIS